MNSLKRWLKNEGIRQKDLAEEWGIDDGTLSTYVRATIEMPDDVKKRFKKLGYAGLWPKEEAPLEKPNVSGRYSNLGDVDGFAASIQERAPPSGPPITRPMVARAAQMLDSVIETMPPSRVPVGKDKWEALARVAGLLAMDQADGTTGTAQSYLLGLKQQWEAQAPAAAKQGPQRGP